MTVILSVYWLKVDTDIICSCDMVGEDSCSNIGNTLVNETNIVILCTGFRVGWGRNFSYENNHAAKLIKIVHY